MDETKIKQSLLEKTLELKKSWVSELSKLLNLNLEICYSYCEEIHFDGYINFIDASTADGKDALVEINGKGEVFLHNGGYLVERENEIKEYSKNIKNQNISIISKYIFIVTSILSLILGAIALIQNRKINSLEKEIKTSQINTINIIGKWGNLTRNDTSYYFFNTNNTWKFIYLSKGKTTILEGKYCINNNREVLLIENSDSISETFNFSLNKTFLIFADSILYDNSFEQVKTYKKMED